MDNPVFEMFLFSSLSVPRTVVNTGNTTFVCVLLSHCIT